MNVSDIRLATMVDVPTVAETLALAMHDDPVFSWWVPDDDRRDTLFTELFTIESDQQVHPCRTCIPVRRGPRRCDVGATCQVEANRTGHGA
jgi:hypothetical protein